jgi:hypothetical protein
MPCARQITLVDLDRAGSVATMSKNFKATLQSLWWVLLLLGGVGYFLVSKARAVAAGRPAKASKADKKRK